MTHPSRADPLRDSARVYTFPRSRSDERSMMIDPNIVEQEIARPGVHTESVGYRIRRVDRFNWELQRYVPPGQKRNGKESAGGWRTDGYFPRLEQAAQAMFDRLVLHGVENPTLPDVIKDVNRAQEAVLQAVREAQKSLL